MKSNNSIYWIIGVILVASVGAIWFFGLRGEDAAVQRPTEISIGTFSKAVDYAPLYVARHFGWFQESESDPEVSFREYGDRTNISQDLASGDLALILAAAPPIIITRAEGTNVSIGEVSCTLRQEIVYRSSLAISSATDLLGQKVAVLKGTSSHYGLLRTLESVGLEESNVNILFLGPAEAKPRFEADEIDAWAVWPPFVEQQQIAGKGRVLPGGGAVIQSVIGVSDSFAAQHPSQVRRLLSIFRRAKAWMLDNPKEAQVIVAQQMDLDLDIVELAWGKHDWSARLDESFKNDIAEKMVFLAKEDLLRLGHEERTGNIVDTSWGGSDTLR